MTHGSAPSRAPMDGSRLRPVRGVTQIEVLVAMLIIGLAAPMIMGGIFASLTRARSSQDQSVATAWAQGEIDYLRRMCYSRLSPSTREVTASSLQPGEPQLPDGFAAVVQLEPAGVANLKATVSLHKADRQGEVSEGPPVLTVSTYVGDIRVATVCP